MQTRLQRDVFPLIDCAYLHISGQGDLPVSELKESEMKSKEMTNILRSILTRKRDFVKRNLEVSDVGFLILRVAVFFTLYSWVIASQLSPDTERVLKNLLGYFATYSVLIYLALALRFERKRLIYGISMSLDLSITTFLVMFSGGFASNFFLGFYFLAAMHSFYYGSRFGVLVATLSAGAYLVAGGGDFSVLPVTDFLLRVGVLYLLSLPIGLLSDQLRSDKVAIETLNCELLKTMHQSELLQKKMAREERFAALGKVAADVAHEIRNPLTAIGGFARRLQRNLSENTREKDYANLIVSESGRLERVLRDVLSFSREPRYCCMKASVNAVTETALRGVSELCVDQSIDIHWDPERMLPDAFMDPEHILQAVRNLLDNAIDAMPAGGLLTVRTRSEKIWYAHYQVIEVADTGPGIAPEKRARIFDPFFTTKEIGQIGQRTGLGLAICRRIMDEHHGEVKILSSENEGSRFCLALPYVPVEDALKTPCWEYMKCGIENLENSAEKRCPAYPHYGTMCWAIAGTLCERKVRGAVAEKIGDCRMCGYYQKMTHEQVPEEESMVGSRGTGPLGRSDRPVEVSWFSSRRSLAER